MHRGKLLATICLCALLAPSTFASVTLSSPGTGTLGSPVHFVAWGTSSCAKGIAAMGIYTAPYVLAYVTPGSRLDTNLHMSPGTHNAVVHEWDRCGHSSHATITVRIGGTLSSVPRSKHVWIITGESIAMKA